MILDFAQNAISVEIMYSERNENLNDIIDYDRQEHRT